MSGLEGKTLVRRLEEMVKHDKNVNYNMREEEDKWPRLEGHVRVAEERREDGHKRRH